MEELLPVLVELSLKLLRSDDVSIMLIGEDKKLFVAASHGLEDEVKKIIRGEHHRKGTSSRES